MFQSASKTLFKAYLWGIETQNYDSDGYEAYQFKAYLWGIETHLPTRIHRIAAHLKPTYEGLKLTILIVVTIIIFRFKAYLWGIETYPDRHAMQAHYQI